MAKKRRYGDQMMRTMVREEYGAGESQGRPRHVMMPNNGGRGPITEDFSKPCGIPYGPISRDLGNGAYFSMNAHRVGDLYEQVDKNMREDAEAIKTLTKPTNW